MLLKRETFNERQQWHTKFIWGLPVHAEAAPAPATSDAGTVWWEWTMRRWVGTRELGNWEYRRLSRTPMSDSRARHMRQSQPGDRRPEAFARPPHPGNPGGMEKSRSPGKSCGQCGGGPCALCDE